LAAAAAEWVDEFNKDHFRSSSNSRRFIVFKLSRTHSGAACTASGKSGRFINRWLFSNLGCKQPVDTRINNAILLLQAFRSGVFIQPAVKPREELAQEEE